MITCYMELYEESEIEHTNGPTHPPQQQGFCFQKVDVLGIFRDLFTQIASSLV